jgi:hypothetical protein
LKKNEKKFFSGDMFKICQMPIKERTEAETDGVVKYLKKNFSIFENTEKG